MHPALQAIREATLGTSYEGDLFLVGGAVRDELLGLNHGADFDLMTRGDAVALARLLHEKGLSSIVPVTYERFGTAMVRVLDASIELVTARRESYAEDSRKPMVEPATLEEDASRRDFTINTLMRGLHAWELIDPLGTGLADLEAKVLRTPLDPVETFRDDPLRMLRAVRFRWRLGFSPAPGLYEAIRACRDRLRIVSYERMRDELVKMLERETAADALQDLMDLGLIEVFAPELVPMVGCEQGKWHHLDVWDHSLLVVRNAGQGDLILTLAALLHDVAKPATRSVDESGQVRFFGHESLGADMAEEILRRLRFPQNQIGTVAKLVKNHMRFTSFDSLSMSAARRLVRDLGDDLDRLLALCEADARSIRPGVRTLDLTEVRAKTDQVRRETPREVLDSPLSGQEIMDALGIRPGPEVGKWKSFLTEKVLEGDLAPGDKETARKLLLAAAID